MKIEYKASYVVGVDGSFIGVIDHHNGLWIYNDGIVKFRQSSLSSLQRIIKKYLTGE